MIDQAQPTANPPSPSQFHQPGYLQGLAFQKIDFLVQRRKALLLSSGMLDRVPTQAVKPAPKH